MGGGLCPRSQKPGVLGAAPSSVSTIILDTTPMRSAEDGEIQAMARARQPQGYQSLVYPTQSSRYGIPVRTPRWRSCCARPRAAVVLPNRPSRHSRLHSRSCWPHGPAPRGWGGSEYDTLGIASDLFRGLGPLFSTGCSMNRPGLNLYTRW